MIGGVPRFGHISEYIQDALHWLLVQQLIHYRIFSIVLHFVLGSAPVYLRELFTLSLVCALGLLLFHLLTLPSDRIELSFLSPSTCNSLLFDMHSLPRALSCSFYKLLNTLLFDWA